MKNPLADRRRFMDCSGCGLYLPMQFCPGCGEVNCENCALRHAESHLQNAELFRLASSADTGAKERLEKELGGISSRGVA